MIETDAPIVIYVTFDDMAVAERTARAVVDQRLGACVNILPGAVSFYEWEGRVERAEEIVMFIKSLKKMEQPLIELITEMHTYDEPAIVAFEVVGGAPSYLAWARGQVGPHSQ